ncbi:RNA-binding S4 domain-containing protein [Ahrensia kielensis]|uniref:RNA-binding S4 domain-containing protein n=1 Tax=Ahrensia kielensis TaxID=76980 RepID=A0ABU9T8V7_9HYPH
MRDNDAKTDAGTNKTSPTRIRLDKWLFFARVIKSRTLAAKFVSSGHVRVNGEKTTQPSQNVKPDDVLTISLEHNIKIYRIIDCGMRRGPAPEAQQLYEDNSPPPLKKPDTKFAGLAARRDPGAGRPTKKERRELDRLRKN